MNSYLLIIFTCLLSTQFLMADESDSHKGHDHKQKKHEEHKNDKNHDHKKDKHDDHDHGKEDHSEDEKDHKGHDDFNEEGAHDDHSGHDEHSSKAVGKGKAIEVVDEKNGFKLSPEAIKTLKLKLQNVDGDEFLIEKSTLVVSEELKGLYRFRGGFFKFHPVELKKEVNGKYLVKVPGVEFGDQIVINGTGLLRVADVYSTDTAEYGHSH